MANLKSDKEIKNIESPEEENGDRKKPLRKKTYTRRLASVIPEWVQDEFRKNGYELKFVRFMLGGDEDYRNIAKREDEGYELVNSRELPQAYLDTLRIVDSKGRKGLVTYGDLCLMKVDVDLRNDRRRVYSEFTNQQLAAVDINVLEKKGFKNYGTHSKTVMREPTFGD